MVRARTVRARKGPARGRASWIAGLLLLALLQLSAATASHAHPQSLGGPTSVTAAPDAPTSSRVLSVDDCPICGVLLGCAALLAKRAIEFDRGLAPALPAPEVLVSRTTPLWAVTASRAPPLAHR